MTRTFIVRVVGTPEVIRAASIGEISRLHSLTRNRDSLALFHCFAAFASLGHKVCANLALLDPQISDFFLFSFQVEEAKMRPCPAHSRTLDIFDFQFWTGICGWRALEGRFRAFKTSPQA
jgi:hypothetical protein